MLPWAPVYPNKLGKFFSASLIERYPPMTSYRVAYSIIEKLYEEGFIAYFAGGWVRDFLMNHPSDDIDIATEASVEEIQKIFSKTIPVGLNFGIVIVVEGGFQFEVATFRRDRGYKDGRRPIGIEHTTPEEDAKRRDFTINGMFYDPLHKLLYDFVGGEEDINKGIVRAIGNPHKRFIEDRLRMIRAVRYASRFHFSIEAETLTAILEHAHTLFPAVAIERIWNELSKMAAYPNFDLALISLHRLNLLPEIFPSLKDISIGDIHDRVHSLPSFPEEAPVVAKVFELFPSSTLEEKRELALYLKLSKKNWDFLHFYHHAKATLYPQQPSRRELSEWAHFYAHPSYPVCLKIIAIHLPLDIRQTLLQEHHTRKKQLEQSIRKIQSKTPLLSSSDLLKEGIQPGKKMGILLKEGERLAINRSLHTTKDIISYLKKTPLWPEE